MLLAEFAVNPGLVVDVDAIGKLTSHLGFHRGAVISEYPKAWPKYVIASIPGEMKGSLEFSIFVEKLRYLEENALVNTGRNCISAKWYDHAFKDHSNHPFFRIIDSEAHSDCAQSIRLNELDENIIDQLGACKCPRSAEELADKAKIVLLNSRNIKLIDPFFTPKSGYKKTLEYMIELANFSERDDIAEWTINTSSIRGGQKVDVEQEKKAFKREFINLVPPGKELIILWWENGEAKEMHPRYLITERAGIKYDWGFEEPNDHTDRKGKMDVDMMRKTSLDETWEQYVGESSRLSIAGRLVLRGK